MMILHEDLCVFLNIPRSKMFRTAAAEKNEIQYYEYVPYIFSVRLAVVEIIKQKGWYDYIFELPCTYNRPTKGSLYSL
jgi:hypothetical protein